MKTFFRLLTLLKPYFAEISLSILLGCATIASGIGLLGISAYLIAAAALHPSIADLQVAIVGVRFFGISRGVFRYLERLVSHSVNLRLLSHLREEFYRQVEPGAPTNIQDARSGDLLDRVLGDLESLENFYVRVIAPVVVAIIIITGVGLFVGGFFWQLGLILASGLVMNGAILPAAGLFFTRPIIKKQTFLRAELSAGWVEFVQGLEDLQSYSAHPSRMECIIETDRQAGKVQSRLSQINGLNNGAFLLVMNLTTLCILWAAIPRVSEGALSGVSLAVITLITMASFEAVNPMAAAAQNLNASLESGNRLFSIGEETETIQDPKPNLRLTGPATLSFHNVDFSYGSQQVLQNMTFSLEKGKKVALVGASGVGKTSVINLLLQFYAPRQGSVMLNGKDLSRYDPDSVRAYFSVLQQSTYIFNSTLRENLLLTNPAASDNHLNESLEHSRLIELVSRLPRGLDTWVGVHGAQLSAGEQQRIGLAHVFLQQRPFLLLDEPTAHLDPVNGKAILGLIFQNFNDRGILLVTHNLLMLDEMDEILNMKNGRIIERGTKSNLLAVNGEFKANYQIQCDLLDHQDLV